MLYILILREDEGEEKYYQSDVNKLKFFSPIDDKKYKINFNITFVFFYRYI